MAAGGSTAQNRDRRWSGRRASGSDGRGAIVVEERRVCVVAIPRGDGPVEGIPGKDAPFVLDFVNEAEDIYRAFKPFYDGTRLKAVSEPSKIEKLKHELDEAQVYHWREVEAFAAVFYKPEGRQGPSDHAQMERCLQPAVDRFKAIDDPERRQEFRDKMDGYVQIYAFLSQIIPYPDRDLEMLYSYSRFLVPNLDADRDGARVKVGDEVALQYYRIERVFCAVIELREGEARYVVSPTVVGTGRANEEKASLSKIIEVLNERFGTQFAEADRLFFQQIKEKACGDEHVVRTALANPLDKFELGIRKLIEELMIERMTENDQILTRYMADREFQGSAFPILARKIFDEVRARAAAEQRALNGVAWRGRRSEVNGSPTRDRTGMENSAPANLDASTQD